MKLKDKMKEIVGINEELINEFLDYNLVGSFINFMDEAVAELGNKEISKKFGELQDLIMKKREELGETELSQTSKKNQKGKVEE